MIIKRNKQNFFEKDPKRDRKAMFLFAYFLSFFIFIFSFGLTWGLTIFLIVTFFVLFKMLHNAYIWNGQKFLPNRSVLQKGDFLFGLLLVVSISSIGVVLLLSMYYKNMNLEYIILKIILPITIILLAFIYKKQEKK